MNFTGDDTSNTFHGTSEADTFRMAQGGDDDVSGAGGNDLFKFGSTFDQNDMVDGGKGFDALSLSGGGVINLGASLQGVETIKLAGGATYSFVMQNSGLHERVTIDGSALGTSDSLGVNGGAETTRKFDFIGGDGADDLLGGQNDDTFIGGGGQDGMNGNGGRNEFIYHKVSDSTGVHGDIITFDVHQDFFSIPTGVTGIDTPIRHGTLDGFSNADFNASLRHAVGHGKLAPHHAVLFTPDHGLYAGQTILVVDANGIAGYQANADYVMHLYGDHLRALDLSNFGT